MTYARKSLERLSSGSAEFDSILGGGFPTGSVSVIAGNPGTGKTVLALQMMFHLARQGRRCLYFMTLSEPMLKLMRFVQGFAFFDQAFLKERIMIRDLGAAVRADGMASVAARVKEDVERDEPDFVVIDSAKALHDFAPNHGLRRAVFYDLAVTLAGWESTSLLVGEYRSEDVGELPEFAVADCIVELRNIARELTTVREIEVLKLRGSPYISGSHFFDIGASGLTFYPRVRAPEQTGTGPPPRAKRVSTGVRGLDALLGGGLPSCTTTVVEGSTGIGKTILGLQFLIAGARAGESVVLLTLEETPEQLRGIARGFGWDLAKLERQRRLVILHTSPVELSTDRFLSDARRLVERLRARRVVFDSLTSAALGVPSEGRFRELIHAMTKHFRAAGATCLMTSEVAEFLGAMQLGGHGISPAADNLILMRYLEVDGRLERAISVLKARGIGHDTAVCRLVIDRRGAAVAGGFTGLHGVLTGMPARRSGGASVAGPEVSQPANASGSRRSRSR